MPTQEERLAETLKNARLDEGSELLGDTADIAGTVLLAGGVAGGLRGARQMRRMKIPMGEATPRNVPSDTVAMHVDEVLPGGKAAGSIDDLLEVSSGRKTWTPEGSTAGHTMAPAREAARSEATATNAMAKPVRSEGTATASGWPPYEPWSPKPAASSGPRVQDLETTSAGGKFFELDEILAKGRRQGAASDDAANALRPKDEMDELIAAGQRRSSAEGDAARAFSPRDELDDVLAAGQRRSASEAEKFNIKGLTPRQQTLFSMMPAPLVAAVSADGDLAAKAVAGLEDMMDLDITMDDVLQYAQNQVLDSVSPNLKYVVQAYDALPEETKRYTRLGLNGLFALGTGFAGLAVAPAVGSYHMMKDLGKTEHILLSMARLNEDKPVPANMLSESMVANLAADYEENVKKWEAGDEYARPQASVLHEKGLLADDAFQRIQQAAGQAKQAPAGETKAAAARATATREASSGEKAAKTEGWVGGGGWGYEQTPDGTIRITAAPEGYEDRVGLKLKPDSAPARAIVAERKAMRAQ